MTTENAAIARHIFTLFKGLYGIHPEVLVRKKVRLKKNNVYFNRLTEDAKRVLLDLKILQRSTGKGSHKRKASIRS